MKRTIIYLLFLLNVSWSVSATEYYVSNKGNDLNDGLTPKTAWATLSKVNSKMTAFIAGDKIFFEKGSTFYGNLRISNLNGVLNNIISFKSYGVGDNPIIKGSKTILNWSVYDGNIYSADVDVDVFQMFRKHDNLQNGKTPKMLYHKVTSVQNNKNQFSSDDLIGHTDVVGATAFVKSEPWRLSARIITSFNPGNGQIRLEDGVRYTLEEGDEFFISNHINLLKSQDEWYYDRNLKKVFIYSNSYPSDIQASILNSNVIDIYNCNFVRLEEISVRNSNFGGIEIKNSKNVEVLNNDLLFNYEFAIRLENGRDNTIKNNNISGSSMRGIACLSESSMIEGNSINETGLIENISLKWIEDDSGIQGGIGISISKTSVSVINNTILNTGYNGIDFRESNAIIKNNFVEDFCLTASDGGGIYTYGGRSFGSKIQSNIVIIQDVKSYAHGIYIDDYSKDIEVSHNSISRTYHGLFLHNAKNIFVSNNNIFNSKQEGILLKEDEFGTVKMEGNVIKDNEIFLENINYTPIMVSSDNSDFGFGSFNNNKYYNPFSKRNIKLLTSLIKGTSASNGKYMTLSEWQKTSNQDNDSEFNDFIWNPFYVKEYKEDNLILNSDFEENILEWSAWQTQLSVGKETDNEFLIIKSTYNSGGLASNDFSIVAGRKYFIEFDAKSTLDENYYVFVRMEGAPYTIYKQILINTYDQWGHFTFEFTAPLDIAKTVISFNKNNKQADLHLDNIKFNEVEFGEQPLRSQLVYNNESGTKVIGLSGVWEDLDGDVYSGSIALEQFTSKILILSDGEVSIINANAGEDVNICKGESTILNAKGGSSYEWSNGEITQSIMVSPKTTTTYSVTVSENGEFDTDEVVVSVNEVVTNAGADRTITEGEIVSLTATGGDSYLWSTGATTETITISPNITNTYTVTAVRGSCEDTDEVKITVNPSTEGNIPVIANAGADVSICNGENTTLTASGGLSYSWNTGATSQSITVSPNSTTTYTVTVSDGSESASDEVIVNVNEVFANAGADRAITEGETITLVANGGDSYLWSTGEKTKKITISPNKTITYSVIAYKGNCQDSDELTVTVELIADTDSSPAKADAGEDMTICLGQSVVLNGTGGESYEWNNGATTGQINVEPNRTTTFRLTASRGGVTSFDEVTITVENCNESTSMDEDDLAILQMSIYPSPTQGDLFIRIDNLEEDANFIINDSKGSTIYSEYISKDTSTINRDIDLSRFSDGLYFVTIYNNDNYLVKKILLN